MMRLGLPLSLCALALLAGCSTSGNLRSSYAPSGNATSGVAVSQDNLLASLDGGLVKQEANIAEGSSDRRKALRAEYRALEYAQAGEAVTWEGDSAYSGTVTPAQPYQVGSQNCRQYSHTIRMKQTSRQFIGAACRNADGSWTLLE